MKNELVLYEKIEKRLMKKRDVTVFPLTPTHRKELRELRDTNVGNLNSRLATIQELKRVEYETKYKDRLTKALKDKESVCEGLNKDWEVRLKKINEILEKRIEFEKGLIVGLELRSDYGDLSNLDKIRAKREYSYNKEKVAKKLCKEQFEDKYGESFAEVRKIIADIVTKYEEAVNFGDLEIVKEIYYMMKNSETFFDKVSNLKV